MKKNWFCLVLQNYTLTKIDSNFELRENNFYNKNNACITLYVFFDSFLTQQKTSSSLSFTAYLWQILISYNTKTQITEWMKKVHYTRDERFWRKKFKSVKRDLSLFVVQSVTLIPSSPLWNSLFQSYLKGINLKHSYSTWTYLIIFAYVREKKKRI